jgi:TRAP transporter TAXI family solute receptor
MRVFAPDAEVKKRTPVLVLLLKTLLYTVAVAIVAACTFALLFIKPENRDLGSVSIATGDTGGPYYLVGGTIAGLLDQGPAGASKLKASVEPSKGSVENVKKLMAGEVDFAIVQADILEDAIRGQGLWEESGPQEGLNVVTRLQQEMVTLVVGADSGIKSLKDLRGKRVNVGPDGSGTRINAIKVLTGAGLNWETELTPMKIAVHDCGTFLKSNAIDAFFATTAHPNQVIKDMVSSGFNVRFIPLRLDELELGDTVAIQKGFLSADVYGGAINTAPVEMLQITALLVTSAKAKNEVVFTLTSRLLEDPRKLVAAQPILTGLTKETATKGAVGQIHPGAHRFIDPEGYVKSFNAVFDK